MKRRLLLRGALQATALAGVGSAWSHQAPLSRVLRFGTTPVFLDDQVGFLARWAGYLSDAVGTKVDFVSRRSYRDIMAPLLAGELDAAWICGFPWVVNKAQLRGLSIPLYRDKPLYQSYLIVPATDTRSASFADLRGKVFAYSDPDSNSGCLVPRTTLMKAGIDPDTFFARSFYTWGHRNVVNAVASGLAQGELSMAMCGTPCRAWRPRSLRRHAWRGEATSMGSRHWLFETPWTLTRSND